MSLLTPEQMQDGLLRLEADLLDLTTQVGGTAAQLNRAAELLSEVTAKVSVIADRQKDTEDRQKRMDDLLFELGASHLRLQDAVEKFLRARTDGQN